MRRDLRNLARVAVVAGMTCAAGASFAQQRAPGGVVGTQVTMPHYDEPGDLANLPLLGRWKINLAKSTQNGSRANSDTFTWVFRIEGNKIRHDIYDVYPADKPSRSYAVMLNGSEATDPHEVGIGETISWWPINRSLFYREVKQGGKVTQHTMYGVSPDGKVFTSQSWSPTTPNPRGMSNLMYFERQEGPIGSK